MTTESAVAIGWAEAIVAFTVHLDDENASPNTVSAYRGDLMQMALYLRNRGVASPSSVSSYDITRFLNFKESMGAKISTCARKYSSAKRFFDFLSEEFALGVNPVNELPKFLVTTTPNSPMTTEEVARLKACIEKVRNAAWKRDLAMFTLILTNGLTSGEVVGLDMSDLIREMPPTLSVRISRKPRQVILDEETYLTVRAYINSFRRNPKRGTSAIFLNQYGKHLTRQGLWQIMKSYGCQIGITDCSPDRLRLAGATQRTNLDDPVIG